MMDFGSGTFGALGNPRLYDIMLAEVLDPANCETLRARLIDEEWRPAGVTREDDLGGVVDPYVRSVITQPVPLDLDGSPLAQVRDAISAMNDEVWRYDLHGFVPWDYPSVLRYEAGVTDHFRRHNDTGQQHPTRKLSFSVQLSDSSTYSGGELLFDGRQRDPAMRRQGMMTVFPSMLYHEVTAVVAGTRDVIVGWVHGPTYR